MKISGIVTLELDIKEFEALGDLCDLARFYIAHTRSVNNIQINKDIVKLANTLCGILDGEYKKTIHPQERLEKIFGVMEIIDSLLS